MEKSEIPAPWHLEREDRGFTFEEMEEYEDEESTHYYEDLMTRNRLKGNWIPLKNTKRKEK